MSMKGSGALGCTVYGEMMGGGHEGGSECIVLVGTRFVCVAVSVLEGPCLCVTACVGSGYVRSRCSTASQVDEARKLEWSGCAPGGGGPTVAYQDALVPDILPQ